MSSILRIILLLILLGCGCFVGDFSVIQSSAAPVSPTTYIKKNSPQHSSLKSSHVKLRVGPGKQYPIEWLLICKNLPVLILAQFDQWRHIRIFDGTEGWVHKSLLSTKKTYLALEDTFLFERASKQSKKKAKLCRGCIGIVTKDKGKWLKVILYDSQKHRWKGWVKKSLFWPNEK